MIVLTYIKLHQSAMRDIVPLVDHAIGKKKQQKNKTKGGISQLRFIESSVLQREAATGQSWVM